MKTKFKLEDWLKDKTQKIITSDGREVEILSYSRRDCKDLIIKNEDYPIVALIKSNSDEIGDGISLYNRNGEPWRSGENKNDITQLYLVTEDKYDLSEFKKKLEEIMLLGISEDIKDVVDEFAPKLFDIAHKTIFTQAQQDLNPEEKSSIESAPKDITVLSVIDPEASRFGYEKYPSYMAITDGGSTDTNLEVRNSYIYGYTDAKNKYSLTDEDIKTIYNLILVSNFNKFGTGDNIFMDVLNEFKKAKGWE